LQDARADGGDVRVVYGVQDAVQMAKREPRQKFVFFAIGFETTAPSTAVEVLNKPPTNLSFLVAHRLIPPAMEFLMKIEDLQVNGFIAPGHVSTIIGVEPYRVFPEKYHMPTVVAGFEPLDFLFAVSMLLQQLKEGRARLENGYRRVVRWNGNVRAQQLMREVFQVVEGSWRGLGRMPDSALVLQEEFQKYDTHKNFDVKVKKSRDLLPGCKCHLVIVGKIKPDECPLFMKACRPDKPRGPCMVSNEGTCRIWARHMKI
jgi:hydrogenase expression/formation protein HypD